jgi:hypothetical protein
MKASALKYGILSVTAGIIAVILLLVPFHAFLTVWLASNIGHYTAVRLWKEVLLAVACLGALYLVVFDRKVRASTLYHELPWLILCYTALQVLWALWSLHHHAVTLKAAAYGLLLNLRFLAFFLAAWAAGARTGRLSTQWSRLLVWPALIVIAFGLLQAFVLPIDFLKHFGYGEKTIFPYETINHNRNYIRVFSTLRGANPLGAYLLLPVSGLLVLMSIGKRNWRRGLMLVGALAVLFLSFSRAAWIGAVLCAAAVGVLQLKRRHLPYVAAATAAVVVAAAISIVVFRHNVHFQNIIFHTQEHSLVSTTSDQGHASALSSGLRDAVGEPLGRGPGTAGPASVYNTGHPVRIAENYFVQLAQETGWFGLGLFLLINGFVAYLLWCRRDDPLAMTLLASLIGITFVNLLSHAWTDDTLAYLWWGLAGIVTGTAVKGSKNGGDEKEAR